MAISSRSIILCFIAAVISLTTFGSTVRAQEDDNHYGAANPVDESDPVKRYLPDLNNPEHQKGLLCAACGAVVEHAIDLLQPLIARRLVEWSAAWRRGERTIRNDEFKEAETVDAYERLCGDVERLYGLVVEDDDYPIMKFSKNQMQRNLRGDWIPFFLSRTCEDLMNDKEEYLSAAIFVAAKSRVPDRVGAVRRAVCGKWSAITGGCDSEGRPIDNRKRPTAKEDL